MARERPAASVSRRLLRVAVVDHGARFVSRPRRVRRPRAARRRSGQARPERRKLRAFRHRDCLRRGVLQIDRLRAGHHIPLPRPRLSAGGARCQEPEEISRPPAAPRDPSVLEQFPDPHLRVDDHPRSERGNGASRERCAFLVRTRAGSAALQLLRGAGLPGLRASAVHGAAALRQSGKA